MTFSDFSLLVRGLRQPQQQERRDIFNLVREGGGGGFLLYLRFVIHAPVIDRGVYIAGSPCRVS